MCVDIDECAVKRRPCHRNAECTNTKVSVSTDMEIVVNFIQIQGSYLCECNQYYKGDGQTCTVDNACQLGHRFHHCGSNDWCVSRGDGEYTCEVRLS